MNTKIFSAHQLKGNVNDLLVRLENVIDENINDENKLSEIIQNVPGGSLVNALNADSSIIPTSQYYNVIPIYYLLRYVYFQHYECYKDSHV